MAVGSLEEMSRNCQIYPSIAVYQFKSTHHYKHTRLEHGTLALSQLWLLEIFPTENLDVYFHWWQSWNALSGALISIYLGHVSIAFLFIVRCPVVISAPIILYFRVDIISLVDSSSTLEPYVRTIHNIQKQQSIGSKTLTYSTDRWLTHLTCKNTHLGCQPETWKLFRNTKGSTLLVFPAERGLQQDHQESCRVYFPK